MTNDIPGWGVGLYALDATELLERYLLEDELEIAKEVHPEAGWPPVNVTIAVPRKQEGGTGRNADMLEYRERTARLLLRIAMIRRGLTIGGAA